MKNTIFAALLMPTFACLGMADVPEVEPNETKGTATPATLNVGDTISGTTTGAVTTAGATSLDTFLVTVPASTRAIRRYTMTLTSPTVGHTMTLRGLSQTTAGVITAGTDIATQTSFTQTDTSRLCAWYGFGNEHQVYVRVTGGAATTGAYSAVLASTPVTPTALASPLTPGMITIRATMTGAATDPEIWVYNRDTLQPVPDFNNDDSPTGTVGGSGLLSTLSRTFAAGRYLLAVSDYNLQCNLPSPTDEAGRGENVMDFPNILVSGDREAAWTALINWHGGADVNAPLVGTTTVSQADNFEVLFVAFDVGNVCPADIGIQGGTPGHDGLLDNNDFVVFVNLFFASDPRADFGIQGGTAGQDGLFDNNDFVVFVNAFFAGCGA